jgi:hypothetical protein
MLLCGSRHVGPLGDYSKSVLVVYIVPVHAIEQVDAFDVLGQIGALGISNHRTSGRPARFEIAAQRSCLWNGNLLYRGGLPMQVLNYV